MAEHGTNAARNRSYRFTEPGEVEIDVAEFADDEAAEAYGRALSESREVPVVIHKLIGAVDWEYVTEVDERP
jgi:hypothetical protein